MKKRKKNSSIVNTKLNQIIQLQKKQLETERKIKDLELREIKDVENEESEIQGMEHTEEKILEEVERLEEVEKQIKSEVGKHPLKKITYKDIGKSMVGAFVGLISHYAVLEGVIFAEEISVLRASFLYFVSLIIGLIVIYYTGFRKIKDTKVLALLPLRLIVIYAVTMLSILILLFVIGKLEGLDFIGVYKAVAALSMPAIIGACVADLIGGD